MQRSGKKLNNNAEAKGGLDVDKLMTSPSASSKGEPMSDSKVSYKESSPYRDGDSKGVGRDYSDSK